VIATLTGKLIEHDAQTAVVDVAGVGYGVVMPSHALDSMSRQTESSIYIYEHIREQEHSLYGFLSKPDKQLFEQLLSVNGVGPKAAMAIFNLGNADRLRSEIASANIAFLTQASGVGKKAAERIVVDLQDKVGAVASGSAISNLDNVNEDALDALLALGYKKEQALQMLDGIEAGSTEDIIKKVLKIAGR